MLKALQDRYEDDKFKHTGKGGDILQFVYHKNAQIGIVVYECKKVKHFQTKHIKQTAEAKIKRNGDYAILVTNATKKNYKGFGLEKGIVIIHPAGLLSLVDLLRRQLVAISDLKLTKAQREEAIEKTIRFIESPEFTNKLEAVIQETIELHGLLTKEIKEHIKSWKQRYTSYKTIYHQTIDVKDKTTELLSGKKEGEKKKVYPVIQEIDEEKETL